MPSKNSDTQGQEILANEDVELDVLSPPSGPKPHPKEEQEDHEDGLGRSPTEQELRTLRKVPGKMSWVSFLMCFVEMTERASYYGTVGPFTNFIQRPIPIGSPGGDLGTGAVARGAAGLHQTPGALGLGLRTATTFTTLVKFLSCAILSDVRWGRYKTIFIGVFVGAIAHILLVLAGIPDVIEDGHALIPFTIAVVLLGLSSGFIRSSFGPLLADQSPVKRQYVMTVEKNELVIVSPEKTLQRYFTTFYWTVSFSVFFSIATTYSERLVGFWLAFLLPGLLYIIVPVILLLCANRLNRLPPSGSILAESFIIFGIVLKSGGWKRLLFIKPFRRRDSFNNAVQSVWDSAKPSVMLRDGTLTKRRKALLDNSKFWDDELVDELREALSACLIFLFIPVFSLCDGGFGSLQTSQASSLISSGVPNDLISNFNAITIVIAAPVLNHWIYPALEKHNISFPPVRRMSVGFFLAALSMATGALIQWRVYETSPCGAHATTCGSRKLSGVSLWAQLPLYALPAIGELFVNVTAYELAYSRAPARMKSMVYSVALFSTTIASAVVLILNATPFLQDPYLQWPFVAGCVACLLSIVCMEHFFRDLNTPVIRNALRMTSGRASGAIPGAIISPLT